MRENKIDIFAQQELPCGEGPVWHPEKQCLYWTDSAGDEIFVAGEKGKQQLLSKGIHAASVTLHAEGGVMLCGKDGFYHLQENGALRMVCQECDGVPVTNVNDIIADANGRVWGGQEKFQEGAAYEPGYLFRIDRDGRAAVVEEGLHLSNGMGFSPQSDVFYLVDTIQRTLFKYDYDIKKGSLSNRRAFITMAREDGLPDGMTVDAEGFIWVAQWFGSGISRYDPDGKLEREIRLPVAQPSSLTFGGKDLDEIFVTSAAVHWESSLAPRDHDYARARGGSVYRIVQDIRGKQEFMARV